MNTIEYINKYKVIAIARGVEHDKIAGTAQALYVGGVRPG